MYGKQILEAEELPIHEHSRKFTDVSCCFTAVAFGLAMLIAAFLHCSWGTQLCM